MRMRAPALEQLQDRPALKRGDGMQRGAARSVVVEAARASTVLPAAAPAAVEFEYRAGPGCGPARLDGAVDEVQQSRFGAGFDTRGHAGGHPRRRQLPYVCHPHRPQRRLLGPLTVTAGAAAAGNPNLARLGSLALLALVATSCTPTATIEPPKAAAAAPSEVPAEGSTGSTHSYW